MGGFLGIGHSSAKTDRSNQLAGINGEWNVFNRGLPFFDTNSAAGLDKADQGFDTLTAAKQKWMDVVSGQRPAINKPNVMAEAAPAINTINEQSDAARKQEAEMGTNRGGGTNAGNQAAETKRMSDTSGVVNDTAVKQQQEGMAAEVAAAKGLEGVGTAQSTAGQRQVGEALQALGLSKEVADEIIDSSITSRPISIKANQAVVQQWSNLLASLGL